MNNMALKTQLNFLENKLHDIEENNSQSPLTYRSIVGEVGIRLDPKMSHFERKKSEL